MMESRSGGEDSMLKSMFVSHPLIVSPENDLNKQKLHKVEGEGDDNISLDSEEKTLISATPVTASMRPLPVIQINKFSKCFKLNESNIEVTSGCYFYHVLHICYYNIVTVLLSGYC